MSDEDDKSYPLPPNLRLVEAPTPPPASERGARPVDPPKPDRPTTDPEAVELSVLVTQAITIRGAQKKDLVPHWLSCDIIRILDPHRQAPRLVRQAARVMLRDLATQTMRVYMPPDDALRLVEEEEAGYVRRLAAEDAAAALARRAPAICSLCGKKPAEEGRTLIIQTTPPSLVCEACIVTTILTEIDRRHRVAAAREIAAREAESVGVSRKQLRQWDREMGNTEPRSRRPKRGLVQLCHPPGSKGDGE